jgi:hypothetical protein
MKALICRNRVEEIIENGEVFPVDDNFSFVDCDSSTKRGDHYIDGKFVNPIDLLTPAEKWEQVRQAIKYLLGQTDWTQLPDVNLKNKDELKTYRQALRDIPQNFSDPDDVKYPERPKIKN